MSIRTLIGTALLATIGIAGCDSSNNENETAAKSATASQTMDSEKGGTFTVGEETWTIAPSIQCSIYPGNIVNIAGHAAGDRELEIVIDWGGPNQARVAKSDGEQGWHAIRDTLQVEVDGRTVRGSATFSEYAGGAGETAEGTFEVKC